MATLTARFLRPGRPFFGTVLAVCAVALAAALVGEHVFGLEPCILCLYERIPYAAAGLVAGLLAALPTSPGLRRLGAGLCLLAFAANAGLGFYHVGVEQHWWTSAVCAVDGQQTQFTVEDLRAALQAPQRPACDEVAWTLFGVSLAGYNLALSLVMAALCAVALWSRFPVAQRSRHG